MLERRFIVNPNNNGQNKFQFTVIQFNVLAKMYAHQEPQGFPLVSNDVLEWNSRKKHLKEEILKYKPDIINLEEVDQPTFFEEFLRPNGYEHFFHRMDEKKTGCLFAYKTSKFKLVWSEKLNISSGTGQVAIISLLQIVNSQKNICFITTHLKAKKDFENTRVEQVEEILDSVYSEFQVREYPIVFSGDLNDTPESKSCGILKEHGFVDSFSEYEKISGEEYWTTFKIRPKEGGEMEMIRRTIDYIYLKGPINIDELLEIPQKLKEDYKDVGLPSKEYPSDHICISSKLSISLN